MSYFNRSDDLKLFYTVHGNPSNPPILLLHAITCDSTDWSFTIPTLAQNYHVITFDLRGHGHSSAPEDASYTVEDSAADAIALLGHLGYKEEVLVMGHSLGAVIASSLTGLYLTVFKGVVLIDPSYWSSGAFWAEKFPRWEELQNFFAFVTEVYGNQLPEDIPHWMLTWYIIRGSATPSHVVGKTLRGMFGEGRLGLKENQEKLVGGRTVPKLAVYNKEEGAELERKLGLGKADQVLQIPGAGHCPHHARPEEFNKILTEWLQKI